MMPLHLRSYGEPDRPAIVLLHGLFGSSANWGNIARALAAQYRVLVPDLRNHGQSPHHPDCGYPAMVDDLLGLLDDQGIRDARLVGHSMGGKVAMQLALTRPQRVRGLAVVDISPVRYGHDFEDVLAAFRAIDLAGLGGRADADRQMTGQVPASGVRAFLLQNLVKSPECWGWRMNLDALAAAQAQILDFPEQAADARYTGPACFIHGTLSNYVLPAHEPTIRQYFPKASLCPVAGAGHWVYAEQPQGFADCLQDFLSLTRS